MIGALDNVNPAKADCSPFSEVSCSRTPNQPPSRMRNLSTIVSGLSREYTAERNAKEEGEQLTISIIGHIAV